MDEDEAVIRLVALVAAAISYVGLTTVGGRSRQILRDAELYVEWVKGQED